ncbi:hypothetical protein HPB50_006519 [Hyalomma asiaticum]|uniref:Uncharacterized protein n=1 Tax=Hyalomma asiaticum TaxID=266040 RepID=A0ACB7RS68_HYAAI|nr:hypothetical protein HPB50_006519 [Hyalomma asiaticum]
MPTHRYQETGYKQASGRPSSSPDTSVKELFEESFELRARRTDSAGLATSEAEVKQEARVEAPQTKAGETGAPETSREGPQSPGAPDADSRPNMDDNQVGNDVSGAQSDSNKESDPGETVLRRSTGNRRPPDRYQP